MTNRLHHFIKVVKISVIYLVNYTTYIVNPQKTRKKATYCGLSRFFAGFFYLSVWIE